MDDYNEETGEEGTAGVQQTMKGSGPFAVFEPHENVLVKQTMRGCLQECMGCEAKSEYLVSQHQWEMADKQGWMQPGGREQHDILYALEQSSCLQRCCLKDGRSMELKLTSVGNLPTNPLNKQNQEALQNAPPVYTLKKPMGCPVICTIQVPEKGKVDIPMCCCLPKFGSYLPESNTPFSESKYACDACLYVPKFDYYEDGKKIYRIKPPTCCLGCCIACECGSRGMCNTTTPFYFHKYNAGGSWDEKPIEDGAREGDTYSRPQITQVFGGLVKECCSDADTFAIKFPREANGKTKGGLLGMCFLIDFTWFEGNNGGGQGE